MEMGPGNKPIPRKNGKRYVISPYYMGVWGYEYFGGTRTVDVHIRRLRNNLQDDKSELIRTVRSSGYSVKVDSNV